MRVHLTLLIYNDVSLVMLKIWELALLLNVIKDEKQLMEACAKQRPKNTSLTKDC